MARHVSLPTYNIPWIDGFERQKSTLTRCRNSLNHEHHLRSHRNCPNHRTVEKSFLNQICEDCLLAEGRNSPLPSQSATMQATTTYHLPTSNSKSGEGLVWDSEVTIEIEGQSPITIDTPTIPEAFQLLGDENKGIFDSHVEITVEADSSSASLEALSSPIFTASQKSGCSLASTLSVGTSPPDAHQVEFFWPSPPSYRKHDDGLRSHNEPFRFRRCRRRI